MNSLTYSLVIGGASLSLFTIIHIYNVAGWNWRVKPVRILLMGLFLLFFSFAAQIYLVSQTTHTRKFLETPNLNIPVKTFNVFTSMAESNELLAKLIELVIIPIAVSLIVAALFAKADLSFQEKVKKYELRCDTLRRLESDLERMKRDIEKGYASGEEESTLKAKEKNLLNRNDRILELEINIEEEFETLIEANLVRPIKRDSRDLL